MKQKLAMRVANGWSYLKTPRSFLGGSVFEYLVVFLIFLVLTVVYTDFVAFHITTQLFAGAGDATAGFLWLNFADPGISPFLSPSNYVNYPYGEVLGGPTFITYTALWMPLRFLSFLFGPVAGLNLVTFWGFISAGLASYWLLKRLTRSIPVALFAGFATAFVPYAMYNSSAHLAYIFSYVFVLIIAGFVAVWRHPTKLRAVLFSGAIALAFYTDGYYVLLASVLVVGLCAAGFLYSFITKMTKKEIWNRIKALLLTVVSLAVLLSPIAYVQLSQGAQIKQTLGGARSNIKQEIQAYRANVIDFMVPAQSNPFLEHNADFFRVHEYKNQRSNAGESTNYIGYILIILSTIGMILIGFWFALRKMSSLKELDKPTRDRFILMGCVTICTLPLLLSFMFSPDIHVFGHRIPLPGAILSHYNIGLWRVMSRFFIPLHVIFVIFAAFSLSVVLTTSRLKKMRQRSKLIWTWVIVGLLGLGLAAEYATTVYHPPYDFTKVQSGYLWLKKQDNIKVVAELPVVDPLDFHTASYVTAQIVHGKKLVNIKEPSDMRLTNTLGLDTNDETIDWAYERGAQAIITHKTACDSVPWGSVIFKDDTDLKKAICIYRLERPITKDDSFIRFGEGFAYSPNQPDPSVVVFNQGKGTLYITDDKFVTNSQSGRVHISGGITGGSKDGKVRARWTITQSGKTIDHGDVKGLEKELSFEVDRRYPIEINITPTDGHQVMLGEFTLVDMKATQL